MEESRNLKRRNYIFPASLLVGNIRLMKVKHGCEHETISLNKVKKNLPCELYISF